MDVAQDLRTKFKSNNLKKKTLWRLTGKQGHNIKMDLRNTKCEGVERI